MECTQKLEIYQIVSIRLTQHIPIATVKHNSNNTMLWDASLLQGQRVFSVSFICIALYDNRCWTKMPRVSNTDGKEMEKLNSWN